MNQMPVVLLGLAVLYLLYRFGYLSPARPRQTNDKPSFVNTPGPVQYPSASVITDEQLRLIDPSRLARALVARTREDSISHQIHDQALKVYTDLLNQHAQPRAVEPKPTAQTNST